MKTMCCDIKEMENGTPITSYFCVKTRQFPVPYQNGFRFNATLADKSGEIKLTYWGGQNEDVVKAIYDSFNIDDIVWVSGFVDFYKVKKISINERKGEIRPANPSEYQLSDFINETNQPIEDMWQNIVEINDSFNDSDLKNLLDAFFNDRDFVEEFKKAPAARYYHHACTGGLLEHTWEVLQFCELIADLHESLNKELLLTGAILHDIGKLKEYTVKLRIKLSKTGMLLGHVFIGTEIMLEKISGLNTFPTPLRDKLIHLVLSHHGKSEWGAFQEPKIPEAAALHYADLLSAKVSQYIRAKKDADTDDFKSYDERIESTVFLE